MRCWDDSATSIHALQCRHRGWRDTIEITEDPILEDGRQDHGNVAMNKEISLEREHRSDGQFRQEGRSTLWTVIADKNICEQDDGKRFG